eukprot:3889970-Rhodomonas_salina.1
MRYLGHPWADFRSENTVGKPRSRAFERWNRERGKGTGSGNRPPRVPGYPGKKWTSGGFVVLLRPSGKGFFPEP